MHVSWRNHAFKSKSYRICCIVSSHAPNILDDYNSHHMHLNSYYTINSLHDRNHLIQVCTIMYCQDLAHISHTFCLNITRASYPSFPDLNEPSPVPKLGLSLTSSTVWLNIHRKAQAIVSHFYQYTYQIICKI